MKQFSSTYIFMLLLLGLFSCSFTKNDETHTLLHSQLKSYYETALTETADEVQSSADQLVECFKKFNLCKQNDSAPVNTLSSTFVPVFSKRGKPLSDFLTASQSLESRWDRFLKNHTFISWIYTFDDISGALRISPATATDLTYGKKMDFRKFEFYLSAKDGMPDTVWQDKPKEDVSGTGAIFIVSTARKIENGIKVVSADVKISSLARHSDSILNQVVVQRKAKSLIFFAYVKSGSGLRTLLSEYATDQAQWVSIRSFPSQNKNFLRISPEEQNKVLDIEKKVESAPVSQVVTEKIMLSESTFSCKVSRIEKPKVMLWLCIQ